MGYAVLHLLKPKGASSSMSAHIERTVSPANADAELTHLNRELIEFPDTVSSRTEAIQHRIDNAGLQRKIGKNQLTAFNVLLSGSNDEMKQLQSNGKLDEWSRDNLDWLRKTYGADNVVSAVLHLDETTPHIHATVVPIVTTERKKKKHEEQAKKRYRKKSPNAARLCLDKVMSRDKLKEYQDTYAQAMAKFGLQRGVRGSDARHIGTSEYYRELINQTEMVKSELSNLKEEQTEAQSELNKVKADVSKEKLKNSAADVGSKLIDGVSSLLGTPKVVKTDMENRELKAKIEQLQSENATIRQRVETVKQNAASQITALKQQFNDREEGLIKENNNQKSTLQKIFDLFPHIKELLSFERFCRQVGFGTEMIRQLFNRENVSFKGKIYSHEYKRDYETDHSVAKVELDPTHKPDLNRPCKFRLTIDGLEVYDWFRQKQKEFLQKLGINPPEQKNNRGMKI